MTRVYDDLVEERHSTMLHDNMDICFLIVLAQHVQETRLKREYREFKRA